MKEATGEANMTIVTILLIGVIAAVAGTIITTLMENAQKKSECLNDPTQCADS